MGQTEPNPQFFADFADSRFPWELQHFGGADFCRKPQLFAEDPSNRRNLQEPVCPI